MEGKTTIQVNNSTKMKLEKLKMSKRETLNDVIENLIEDSTELSEKTKREIEESLRQIESVLPLILISQTFRSESS